MTYIQGIEITDDEVASALDMGLEDYLYEAKDEDEAVDEFNNAEFNPADSHSGDLEVEKLCDMCETPEDLDGRCNCTNDDSK